MTTTHAYAARSAAAPLGPFSFDRRALGAGDVLIAIRYCGVCHSDLHTVKNEWGHTVYPVVPGHEIVGEVLETGSAVRSFKPGDLAGVGCMVDSCRTCPECQDGLEQFCEHGAIFTYNSPDRHTGGVTYGGYATHIVVDQDFVLRIPRNLDLAATAPLLCAGITTYSPLRHWGVGKGSRVGVVGLGGLGHMALKLAHAFGAHVTLFTTSAGKAEDARRLGADAVVVSGNAAEMKARAGSLDFILDTAGSSHKLDPYLRLLKRDGTMCLVGLPEHGHPPPDVSALINKRRQLAGSLIGGIRETQEMLDFCGAHNVVSDIELIPIQKINEAYERMLKSDVRYRFVIDLGSLR
ncbi:MAG: NAD(P)-dependent alcohol dehydrogenase [Desulfovibrionaceae bacterium]|nr:NAD(P)-dependent alcohol dehydrogenase [Desulfovibrionaceae bacterium]